MTRATRSTIYQLTNMAPTAGIRRFAMMACRLSHDVSSTMFMGSCESTRWP